jgi:hypothetical protein
MSSAAALNGRNGDPAGTGTTAPHGEENGTLPDASGAPSINATPDGPMPAGTPAAPDGGGTRDFRGRFTRGNPGRPRHRTGAPIGNGDNGAATLESAGPPPPPAAGRDAGGRFARGNVGGPGNPFARRVAALRQALLRAVTEEDVQDVAKRLLELARVGDVAAMKLLLGYVLGRPAEVVDPDTLDLREWQLYRESLAPPEEMRGMLGKIPPEFGLLMLRLVLPSMADRLARAVLDGDARVNRKRRAARAQAAPEAAAPPDQSTVTNR